MKSKQIDAISALLELNDLPVTSGIHEKILAGIDSILTTAKNDPYYPFKSEIEWLEYENMVTEKVCDILLRYNGKGKFGGEKMQKVADLMVKTDHIGNAETIKTAKMRRIE